MACMIFTTNNAVLQFQLGHKITISHREHFYIIDTVILSD